MGHHLRTAGRAVALAGCLATAVSWGWILSQALGQDETLVLAGIAGFMVILGIAGLHATLAENYRAMYLVSILWFVPYGFYVSASGLWYVGVSNLLYLLGAIQLHLSSRLDHRDHLQEGP